MLVGSELLLLERRIYNHLKYEDRFMMILSGKFIREILDLPQTFNVLCKTRTSEEMDGALNEIAVFEDIFLYHSNHLSIEGSNVFDQNLVFKLLKCGQFLINYRFCLFVVDLNKSMALNSVNFLQGSCS